MCQRPTSQEFCDRCYKQLQKCCLPNPSVLWHQPLPVFSWGTYGGSLKRAIAALKYQNQPQIARPLGQWLGEAWVSYLSMNTQCVVVPIPMHPNKQKKRGYNQAALIAKSFCETTGLRLKLNGLERVRETEALYPLSPVEREKKLAEAFGIGKDFSHGSKVSVLLIDDIYTTGSTVRSATKTLHQAGIFVLGVATTATTHRGV
ncbi:MAG: ComF family protein [Scytonema sp. PMC 1069.18]|nr:ComF family protein [Scytonema sp. PMC 1069.18]MEC4886485.1 ComF family protein [Scytonema sp. PMC 1070.18]